MFYSIISSGTYINVNETIYNTANTVNMYITITNKTSDLRGGSQGQTDSQQGNRALHIFSLKSPIWA